MTRQVIVTSRAKKQLYESALWWSEHRSTAQAIQWLQGFETAIADLAFEAERQPLIPEELSLIRLPENIRAYQRSAHHAER